MLATDDYALSAALGVRRTLLLARLLSIALLGCGGARTPLPVTHRALFRPQVVVQRGHSQEVRASAWLGDELLVTTGTDSTVRVWDAGVGALRGAQTLSNALLDYGNVRVSDDGRFVAAWASMDGAVAIWSLANDSAYSLRVENGFDEDGERREISINDVAFGPQAGDVTVATSAGVVVWRHRGAAAVRSTLGRDDVGECVALDHGAEHAFCRSPTGALILDIAVGAVVTLPAVPVRGGSVHFSRSGELVAVRTSEREWTISRTSDGGRVGVVRADAEDLEFLAGETHVLVATAASLEKWTIEGVRERAVAHPYPETIAPVPGLGVSADGSRALTQYHWFDEADGETHRVVVWDTTTITRVADVTGSSGVATLSQSGAVLRWGADGGSPVLWDVESGSRRTALRPNTMFDAATIVAGEVVVSRRPRYGSACATYVLSASGTLRATLETCGRLTTAGDRLLVHGESPVSSSPLVEYLLDDARRPLELWDLHPADGDGMPRRVEDVSTELGSGNWMSTDRTTFFAATGHRSPRVIGFDLASWEPLIDLSVPRQPMEVDASPSAGVFAVRIDGDVVLSTDGGARWSWLTGIVRENASNGAGPELALLGGPGQSGIALVGDPPLLVTAAVDGFEARDTTGERVAWLTGVRAAALTGNPTRREVAFLAASPNFPSTRSCVGVWRLDDEGLAASSAGYHVQSRAWEPSDRDAPVTFDCGGNAVGSRAGFVGYYDIRYADDGAALFATTNLHEVRRLSATTLDWHDGLAMQGGGQVHDVVAAGGIWLTVDGTLAMMRTDEDGDTIRILLAERRGAPFLLTTTDDGRFSGDERVHDEVWIRIGSDVAHAPMVQASDLYYSFYTPDLNERFAGGGIGGPPRELARGVSLPPRITWEPMDTNGRVVVRARVDDMGGGIVDPGMLVDGARVPARVTSGGDGVRVEAALWLGPGRHEVEAVAFSEVGRVRARSQPLELTGAVSPPGGSVLRVLVVTADRYRDPTLRLQHRGEDGAAISEALRSLEGRGYDAVEVITLRDEDATREAVLHGMRELTARTTPSDTLVAYFAAHGLSVRCDGEDAELRIFLHGVSRDETTRCTETISAREIGDQLFLPSLAMHELLILDSCDAGAATTGSAREGRALRNLGYLGGLPVIAASRAGTIAHEYDELGHGALTYAILEAFAQAGDGALSVWGLEDAVLARVPELAARQTPVVSRGRIDFMLVAARAR